MCAVHAVLEVKDMRMLSMHSSTAKDFVGSAHFPQKPNAEKHKLTGCRLQTLMRVTLTVVLRG